MSEENTCRRDTRHRGESELTKRRERKLYQGCIEMNAKLMENSNGIYMTLLSSNKNGTDLSVVTLIDISTELMENLNGSHMTLQSRKIDRTGSIVLTLIDITTELRQELEWQ
jgi:hypothetical protein